MQPMIRPNQAQAASVRRFNLLTVLVILTVILGGISLRVGEISLGILTWVAAAMLWLVQGMAANLRASNERLEAVTKEISAMRQLLAITVMRGNPGGGETYEPKPSQDAPAARKPDAPSMRHPGVPQPAGD